MMDTLLRYGYVILFLYSLGGGMVGILCAGILSSLGKMELSWCIALSFIANTLGSSGLYLLGKYYKKDFLPYFKNHRRKLALALLKIKQHGTVLIFSQKFIYGLKTFIPIAAALAKYDAKRFLFLNALASFIWALSLGFVGFAFGGVVEGLFDKFGAYSYAGPLFLVFLIVILLGYLAKFSQKNAS